MHSAAKPKAQCLPWASIHKNMFSLLFIANPGTLCYNKNAEKPKEIHYGF